MTNKFGIILVKPQLGENIGACARSMKNFGFSKLHIVSPKINFPNPKVKATSVGAYNIIKNAKVPIIVDAGIGTASDATIAMELGCDGVLVNSAIAKAKNPILMAESFKNAVSSGRQSFIAGRMQKLFNADPSSPTKGLI